MTETPHSPPPAPAPVYTFASDGECSNPERFAPEPLPKGYAAGIFVAQQPDGKWTFGAVFGGNDVPFFKLPTKLRPQGLASREEAIGYALRAIIEEVGFGTQVATMLNDWNLARVRAEATSGQTGVKGVLLRALRLDGGTQCRAALDSEHTEALVNALERGQSLPPAIVFFDGADFWLADGFHRHDAAQKRGADELLCEVRNGSRIDAVRYALSANATHGLRRTNADKRRAIEIALKEFPNLSSRHVADLVAVDHKTVESIRPAVGATPAERVGADGKTRAVPAPKDPNELPLLPKSYAKPEEKPPGDDNWTKAQAELRTLIEKDRGKVLPALVTRARVIIQSIKSIRQREIAWLLSGLLTGNAVAADLDDAAAMRQEVKTLAPDILSAGMQWGDVLGLNTLGNIDQVAALRVVMDIELEHVAEIVKRDGPNVPEAEFLRWLLETDSLGFREETEEGRKAMAREVAGAEKTSDVRSQTSEPAAEEYPEDEE